MDCILYGRVSTDRQDMQRQERMFAAYCEHHQFEPVLTLLDADTSGSIPFLRRAQGGRLLAEMSRREPTALIVVTTEQDRIGRDTLDIIATIRGIWQCGVVPHFIAEGGALPRSPENELRMEIKASVAQYERNKIRQRIQSKLDGKRANGELCGTLSFGWNVRYCFADGFEMLVTARALQVQAELQPLLTAHGALLSQQLEASPAEQHWLRQMCSWRRAGWSYGRIAAELNAHRVQTKQGAARVTHHQNAERFRRGRWQCGNVHKVLNSRTTREWLAESE